MYQASGDPSWSRAAGARQAGLAGEQSNRSTHDLGFILFDSFGKGYRLTAADSYRRVVLGAARSVASRYRRSVRAIRSWNNPPGTPRSDFRVVIDSLMNLDLLFWASQHGGGQRLASKARKHALRTARVQVRPNGSTYHLVIYNGRTGAVKRRTTAQGYRSSSTWSRGQAWALYGFGTAYADTRVARMLEAARRTADYFVSHLPADRVPYWDFNAPGIPHEPRDSSAAALAVLAGGCSSGGDEHRAPRPGATRPISGSATDTRAITRAFDTIHSRYRREILGGCMGAIAGDAHAVKCYGRIARGSRRRPMPQTLFQIGSITKTFTATLLALRVHQGAVRLSDPIGRYISAVAGGAILPRSITLLDMADHYSGLPRSTPLANALALHSVNEYFSAAARCVATPGCTVGRPGGQYVYSNFAYGILGQALGRRDGYSPSSSSAW